MSITKESAEYFYHQCADEYCGHMSKVPYHPNIYSFVHCYGASTKKEFAKLLKAIAEELEKDGE